MAAALSGGACAMESPNGHVASCQVVDGDKLPAESGGQAALCDAIQRAVMSKAPNAKFTVEVKVLSSSRLAATLTSEGRTLPDQKFASMDRELTRSSFERFAAAIADQIAQR